jgi:Flp pilus assembly protein TadD
MTPRLILTFGMSALMLGGTMVGCTGGTTGRIAAASDRNDALSAKAAASSADKAIRALDRRDPGTAVRMAEGAVAMAPRDAAYRMLLGQSYLQAGRFTSARAAFADVLQLYPANGKAALNLALAQIATGDWSAAQATLTAHAAIIPAADLGLATALAGDPAKAVDMLNAAARAPGATAKVRQNLALSYALAGQWNMARVAAAADMSPADLDARLEQWAAFAQPRGASDQVASLLGVTPASDTGLPVALALDAAVPVAPVAEAPVQVAAVVPLAVPAPVETPAAQFAKVTFAPRSEVVQPLPTMLIRADATPAKLALGKPSAGRVVQMVPAARPFVRAGDAGGDWYVQIGAFSNIAVARSGWNTATRRFAALSGHQPTGTTVAARQGSLYRVSVGGFTRDSADAMCRAYRSKGGACFVRREAGDRMAQWLRAPVQMASR